MEKTQAVAALAALAQDNRLDVFRLLVQAGPEGMPAGQVADALGLAPNTLTFHFDRLRAAGLVTVRRDGRSMIYAARFDTMNALLGFLTENCCQGARREMRACRCASPPNRSAPRSPPERRTPMKRMHVHVSVEDLDKAVGFYSALFAAKPTVVKTDYAKWMLDDPRVNFAISTRGREPGLDHLGIQVESADELQEVYARLRQAGGAILEEGQTDLLLRQVGEVVDRRSGRHLVGDVPHHRRRRPTTARACREGAQIAHAKACCDAATGRRADRAPPACCTALSHGATVRSTRCFSAPAIRRARSSPKRS